MTEPVKTTRLSKAASEFNVGHHTIIEFLKKKGHTIDPNPNTKLTEDQYALLAKEYQSEKLVKEESKKIGIEFNAHQTISIKEKDSENEADKDEKEVLIKSTSMGFKTDPKAKEAEVKPVAKPVEEPAPKLEPKVEEEKAIVEPPVVQEVVAPPIVEVKKEEVTERRSEENILPGIKIIDKIDVDAINQKSKPGKKQKEVAAEIQTEEPPKEVIITEPIKEEPIVEELPPVMEVIAEEEPVEIIEPEIVAEIPAEPEA